MPVNPGLRAGTRGVSASAAVAPPPRVSAADHDRVADLIRKGNGKHVLSARVRAAPRVVVAARLRVRVRVGRAVDDAPEGRAEGAEGVHAERLVAVRQVVVVDDAAVAAALGRGVPLSAAYRYSYSYSTEYR